MTSSRVRRSARPDAPAATTGRTTRPRVRLAAGAAAVAVLGGTFAVLAPRAGGFSSTRFEVVAGSAWLPSYRIGQVALVDGTTSDTVARVDVVDRETNLDVVQAGTSAVVVERETGAVTRVDGATLDRVVATPFGRTADLQPFAGPSALFVYDRARGALAVLDSQTLGLRRRVALAPARNERSVTVDGAGSLWVISGDTGALRRYDAAGTALTGAAIADPAASHLALVRGRPVVVDLSGDASVRPVDPRSGALGAATCLPGDRTGLRSAGSQVRDLVYFSDSTAGALLVSDLGSRQCSIQVPLAARGAQLGPPLEVGDVVLVADWTNSRVMLVDTRTWTVRQVTVPVPRGSTFDLLKGTGFAYYNDPRSEHAGVITLSGAVISSKKYDPNAPSGPGRFRTRKNPTSSPSATPRATATQRPNDRPTPDPSPTGPTSSSPGQDPTAPAEGQTPPPTPTPSRPGPVLRIAVAAPPSPQVDEQFRFQARLEGDQRIVGVDWTFGDGGAGEGIEVSHSFAQARGYSVTATARLSDGTIVSRTVDVDVRGEKVVQIASAGPGEVDEDVPTRFSATFLNGTPTRYQWTVYAPGSSGRIITTSPLAEPTFTFAEPTPDAGEPYIVVLRIDGDERSVPVVVGPARPSRVAVTCTPSRPVVASRVTCAATASGYVSEWRWTVTNAQTGTVTRTTTTGRLTLAPLGENLTRVEVVATNRTGSSAPAVTELAPDYTALGVLSCTPSPVVTDTRVTCTVTAYGWSSGFEDTMWSLTDESGRSLSGAISSDCDGECRLRWTTRFTTPGDYMVAVSYRGPGGRRVTNGGVVSVREATRTLTVVAPSGSNLSTDDHTCAAGRTCRWTYPRGTQVAVRADPLEGYNVYGWQPDCVVDRQPSVCAVVLDDDVTVRALSAREVTLRVSLDAGPYCSEGQDPAEAGCTARPGPLSVRISNDQGDDFTCELFEAGPLRTCALRGQGPVVFEVTTDHQRGVTWRGCDSSTSRRCTIRLTDTDPYVEATFR